MFSFLTGLLLFKSSGRLGGKAAETQLEPSNLVEQPNLVCKSDDLKLIELKHHESTTSFGSLNKTQNDSQLNSSNLSFSKSATQSSQLDKSVH